MSEAASDHPKKSILLSFPRAFWLANVMELFERGAYYGLNALLARYLTDKVGGGLGFREDEVGLLQGTVYAATYLIPILGGALADRYGYRRMLLVAFSLLSAGYFLSGRVDRYWVIFATLLLMATGAGLFKPIIAGTLARTTTAGDLRLRLRRLLLDDQPRGPHRPAGGRVPAGTSPGATSSWPARSTAP